MRAAFIPAIAALFIGFLTLAVFLPAINNGFVNWDDDRNVVTNLDFRGFDWSHLKWMWTNRLMSHYVPLTWMSFGLDYVIWKEKGLGYHLTNVLLHAANAAVFFLLALAIFKRVSPASEPHREGAWLGGAAFAALFFSLHPLRVESVAWVTERRDVLSGLFYLLALLVYVRAFPREPRGPMPRKAYLGCLGLFVMSILSKEIAVTLPAILLLLDVYPLRRLGGPRGWAGREVRSIWLEKIPFLAIGLADGAIALYSGIRNHLVEPVAVLGWVPRMAITVYGMAFYVRKTIVPLGLSPLYPLTRYKTMLSATPFQLSAGIVLFVTLTCVLLRRRFPGLLLVWIAYAVTLLPVGGIIHNGFQITADRYTYLACLGFALLAGAVVSLGWRALHHSRIASVLIASAALLVLFSLSFLTRKQIAFWKDSGTLWTRVIAVEPSFVAHMNLGSAFSNEGDSLGAAQQFRKAIAMWPDNAGIHSNLGKALLDLHQWEEAAQEFRRVIELEASAPAFNSLAHALTMQGKLDEAIEALRSALRTDPANADAGRNLELVLEMKKRHEQGETGAVPRQAR